MNNLIINNQKKRIHFPIWLQICFAMFNVWQMGFIYFMGPSLVINSRTPLPISMDNIASLIVVAYLLSIVFMCILPFKVVLAQRLSAIIALLTVICLYLPLTESILEILIYIHVFSCCFMIGFETFLIVNLFSEESAIEHLTLAYSVSLVLIAIVQNEIVPISFSMFQILTIIMLIMMLIFFFACPTNIDALPKYLTKKDKAPFPKPLFYSVMLLFFVSSLAMVCGPAAISEIDNGVSISYLFDAIATIIIYVLYKHMKIHPLRSLTFVLGLSIIGYLFLYASNDVPALSSYSCMLIGLGFLPCQMIPLFGIVLMKNYPSRFISPLIIGIALVAVIVQSSLVEIFRNNTVMLQMSYLFVVVILGIIYFQVSPFVQHNLQRKIEVENESKEITNDTPLSSLTKREFAVLELISSGYSNTDIANILVISVHTVNDYTKKIYKKLDVHNRHSAANLFNKYHSK